eukprot:1157906-Pelagomonas_calceolata.AAC.3
MRPCADLGLPAQPIKLDSLRSFPIRQALSMSVCSLLTSHLLNNWFLSTIDSCFASLDGRRNIHNTQASCAHCLFDPFQICLPDSPHPDEQDPSSYVAHAPANTVSSLMLLTHLDLWGYSGNPTHLLLVGSDMLKQRQQAYSGGR